MSGNNRNPSKFPYLVLRNVSADDIEGNVPQRSKDGGNKRETGQRKGSSNSDIEKVSFQCSNSDFLSLRDLCDPLVAVTADLYKNADSEKNRTLNPAYSKGFNISHMKAVLSAQSELRQPTASLYPRTSQISLIPETELIYKKYFPVDDCGSNSVKSKDKEKPCARTTATISSCEEQKQEPVANDKVKLPSQMSPSASKENQMVSKTNDADARFRKRTQQQLLSLSTQVESQSAELCELKRELKDMRNTIRKNAINCDSCKSSIDSLSKNVFQVDNKLDSLKETVNSQEKNLISKLMMVGEFSDSDSEFEDNDMKSLNQLSALCGTKFANQSLSKRSESKASVSSSSDSSSGPKFGNWIPIAPDFDKLLNAVAILNHRMDRNQSMKLCPTSNGATFKHADVVDLTLFKNGMVLGSTGFRSYSTMSVIRFVNEIFNGYLPTELSTQYPDGVIIILNDKRSILHTNFGFNGFGSKLCKVPSLPPIVPGSNINALTRRQSTDTSEALATTSLSESSSVTSVNGISTGIESLPDLRSCPSTAGRIVVLKIHHRERGRKYKLKVPTNATVKAVTDHLIRTLQERDDLQSGLGENVFQPGGEVDIILPVPYGKLSCSTATLEEYGIIHNTLVYIQTKGISANPTHTRR